MLPVTFSQLQPANPAFLSRRHVGYSQIVIIQRIGIEHADGFIRLTLRTHDDKGKAIGRPAVPVFDDIDGCDIPGSREQDIQIFPRRGPGQIPYIDLGFHDRTAFSGGSVKRAASP